MFIYDTSRYLEIINHGLNTLLPQLHDDQAKAVVGILQRALKELYKREGRTRELLARTNPEGLAIANDIVAALATRGVDTTAASAELRDLASGRQQAESVPFDALQQDNNRLNALLQQLIAQLGQQVRDAPAAERTAAMTQLRRAADWDFACSAAQREPIEFLPFELGAPPTGDDLSRENLQRLIDERRPGEGLKVAALKRIPGGMGKHTWGLSLTRPDNTREELIVRKEGPRPLVSRGAWRIAAEYRLLERVVAAGFNAPKPLMLAESDPAFDADFFIMERKQGVVPGNFFGPTMEIREELLLDLAAHMARLHAIPYETFGDYLAQYMDPRLLRADVRGTYRLELEYWQRYIADNALPHSPALAYITEWMLANIPDNRERPVLVHGDLNIHNFLVVDHRISTVLDWELALPGDPAQDIAYIKPNIEKLIAWDKFMACYYANGGRRIDESTFNYYVAFGNYRPLVVSLRNMALLRDRASDDVRLPYVDTDFVPQFVQNILAHIR
jgi:aminoglycoside phosphotransferase (APT) family kinase protein